MTGNKQLLEKADLTLTDLQNDGGLLEPETSARFIRKLIDQPTILRQARVVEMMAPQRKINKIGFGSRIMRKATSGTALSQADRSKPTTELIQLSTNEVIAEVRIPYEVMEDNIERATAANNEASNSGPGGLRDTIIDLIAERAALDLEELGLLGDTGSADTYLAINNGYIKIAETDGNLSDVAGAAISKAVFRDGVKVMPDKYLRNKAQMRHFVSYDQETNYRDTVADRATGLGDSVVTGMGPVYAFGVPVEAVALMPDTKGLFTNPKNLIYGIQRQVSLEYDKSITERIYIIVLTARIDYKIEEPEAVVVYNNVAV